LNLLEFCCSASSANTIDFAGERNDEEKAAVPAKRITRHLLNGGTAMDNSTTTDGSALGAAGPMPPVSADYKINKSVYASTITMCIIAAAAVAARFYTRLVIRKVVGAEDYCILVAFVRTYDLQFIYLLAPTVSDSNMRTAVGHRGRRGSNQG
jgi:hypothetical protein